MPVAWGFPRRLYGTPTPYPSDKDAVPFYEMPKETEIELCVINTGIEISPEEQELVFTPFYPIPNNDPWQYGGTGLGLTLVQKLTKVLGASVTLECRQGKTIFCVKFPQNLFDINQEKSS
ncbi:MAG: ATP-binding protein [Xenococcaceae cyanobacterium MO_167.B27]|nr:ATP-binding protein [Xenococcaceae cyanobacterium MO_167.B27]